MFLDFLCRGFPLVSVSLFSLHHEVPRPPPACKGSRGSAGCGGCCCRRRSHRSCRRCSGNGGSRSNSGSSSRSSRSTSRVPVEPLLQRRGDVGRGSRGRGGGGGAARLPLRVEVEPSLAGGLQDLVPLNRPGPRPGGHRPSGVIVAALPILRGGGRRWQVGLGGDEGRERREGEGGVCFFVVVVEVSGLREASWRMRKEKIAAASEKNIRPPVYSNS